MDRYDFINRIISMYPYHIKDGGVDAFYDRYNRALGTLNIDYEKLFDIFSTEYEDKTPPTGKWLKDNARRCYKADCKKEKWQHVKVYHPKLDSTLQDCFPTGTTQETILNTYRTMFPETEGWRIVQ